MSPYKNLNILMSIVVFVSLSTESTQSKGHVTRVTYFTLKKCVSNFKAVLLKFDETYPADIEKRDQFVNLANDLRFSEDLLLAEMVIQDDPRLSNKQSDEQIFASQLNSSDSDQFPILYLFVDNQLETPIQFTGEKFDTSEIKHFVRSNVPGIRLRLEACIEELDQIVENFIKTLGSDDDPKQKQQQQQQQQNDLLKKVQQFLDKIETESDTDTSDDAYQASRQVQQKLQSATVYLKLMGRILEKGTKFLDNEQQRVKNLLTNSKLSDVKMKELQNRLNILDSFSWAAISAGFPGVPSSEIPKDEL